MIYKIDPTPYILISKSIWATVVGWLMYVLIYLLPIKDLMYCISVTFAINFLAGYIVGMVLQKEHFQIRKGLWAFAEASFFMAFLILLFVLGDWTKQSAHIFKAINISTWAWIYFYSINILRNAKRIFPDSKPIAFLYYILSLECVKSIPYLKNFEENHKQNADN